MLTFDRNVRVKKKVTFKKIKDNLCMERKSLMAPLCNFDRDTVTWSKTKVDK